DYYCAIWHNSASGLF
nr:immunoglobulin light chain junction region [Macaca mulatta]